MEAALPPGHGDDVVAVVRNPCGDRPDPGYVVAGSQGRPGADLVPSAIPGVADR